MSQTETLLLVVLGFALATLIALFVGRLLWAAALKLGARRMQKQVPTTLVGLQTERDRLRAEYAMLSQRLGTRLEGAKLRIAEQMAEVSRHRNRLELLESEKQASLAEVAGLKQQIAALTEQLNAAHANSAALQNVIAERSATLEQLRHDMATWTSHGAQHADIPAPAPEVDPESRLRDRINRLNQMAQSVARDRTRHGKPESEVSPVPEPPLEPPTDPLIIAKLKEAEIETGDLQRELEKLDAEWSKRLGEMKEQDGASEARSETPTAVANVISLANRIRDLKKGLGAG